MSLSKSFIVLLNCFCFLMLTNMMIDWEVGIILKPFIKIIMNLPCAGATAGPGPLRSRNLKLRCRFVQCLLEMGCESHLPA